MDVGGVWKQKYQLGKQEIFKAIKNNRALSGLEGFLLAAFYYFCVANLREQNFKNRRRRAEIENFLDESEGGFLFGVINDGFLCFLMYPCIITISFPSPNSFSIFSYLLIWISGFKRKFAFSFPPLPSNLLPFSEKSEIEHRTGRKNNENKRKSWNGKVKSHTPRKWLNEVEKREKIN